MINLREAIDNYSLVAMDCGYALGKYCFSIEEAKQMLYDLKPISYDEMFCSGKVLATAFGSIEMHVLGWQDPKHVFKFELNKTITCSRSGFKIIDTLYLLSRLKVYEH